MFQKTKLLIFVFTVIIVFSCWQSAKSKPDAKKEEAAPEKVPVEVITVKRANVSASLTATGTVEANIDAVISAEVGGEVVAVYAEEGASLKKGDPLLKIDDYTLKLQRERAEANLTGMASGYEYINKIAVLQVETRSQQAEAAAAAALSQYEFAKNTAEVGAEAKLKQAQAAYDMAQARSQLLKTGARPEEREQIEAAKTAAKANYDAALKNYERVQNLYAQGAVSPREVEEANARKEGAEAQWKMALENWNLVQKGAREEDIAVAEANLMQAKAFLRLAEEEHKNKGWEKDIAMAKSAFTQAEANAVLMKKELDSRAYEAEVRQAEARFKDAQASLKIIDRQLEKTTISAPFDGEVYGRMIELGEMSAPGQPLIKLIQTDIVKVSANISEINIASLHKGQSVIVTVDAYPDKEFTGKITELSPAVEPTSRTILIKAELDNPKSLLKPGMFARLTIETEKRDQALVLPKDVLIQKDNRQFVYLVLDGKAVIRDVKLGLEMKDYWEVKQGLKENDVVVSLGQSNLSEGKEVSIIKK